MWSIFHCLALGTLIMTYENEDYNVPRWDKEKVHFDIKQENRQLETVCPFNNRHPISDRYYSTIGSSDKARRS